MPLRPRSLVASAALFLAVAATATVAHATTIVFGTVTGGSPSTFTSYTQAGTNFTVTQGSTGSFDLNPNQGNPPPGITSGTDISEPTSSIVLTDAGSTFEFSSFDLDSYTGTASYTLVGTLNGASVFDIVGSDNTSSLWATINTGVGTDVVNSVTLTFSDTAARTEYSVDNLVVTPTPEPSSLILLGTGILGLGAMARRRLFA